MCLLFYCFLIKVACFFFFDSWKCRMNGNRIPLMSFSHRDESKCVISNVSCDVLYINFRTCMLLVEIVCADSFANAMVLPGFKYLEDSREVCSGTALLGALFQVAFCLLALFPPVHICRLPHTGSLSDMLTGTWEVGRALSCHSDLLVSSESACSFQIYHYLSGTYPQLICIVGVLVVNSILLTHFIVFVIFF